VDFQGLLRRKKGAHAKGQTRSATRSAAPTVAILSPTESRWWIFKNNRFGDDSRFNLQFRAELFIY
jgi:hypothetical protein